MIHTAEKQDNTAYVVDIATSDVCCTVTSVKCPFGHTLGTSAGFFFPWKRYISDKQEPGTEGTFLEFCCLKQNNKKYVSFVVVLDQQLLIYVLEKVQRTRSFWKGF